MSPTFECCTQNAQDYISPWYQHTNVANVWSNTEPTESPSSWSTTTGSNEFDKLTCKHGEVDRLTCKHGEFDRLTCKHGDYSGWLDWSTQLVSCEFHVQCAFAFTSTCASTLEVGKYGRRIRCIHTKMVSISNYVLRWPEGNRQSTIDFNQRYIHL